VEEMRTRTRQCSIDIEGLVSRTRSRNNVDWYSNYSRESFPAPIGVSQLCCCRSSRKLPHVHRRSRDYADGASSLENNAGELAAAGEIHLNCGFVHSSVFLPHTPSFNWTTAMSSISRTFLRTSRNALKYQRGVNPVQQAWGAQGKYGVRNYAAVFQRDKPHVNIGALLYLACQLHLLTGNRNYWSRRSRKGTTLPLAADGRLI